MDARTIATMLLSDVDLKSYTDTAYHNEEMCIRDSCGTAAKLLHHAGNGKAHEDVGDDCKHKTEGAQLHTLIVVLGDQDVYKRQPVGDVDSPHRKLSQKAYPVVCGEKKALLRKCNNPL